MAEYRRNSLQITFVQRDIPRGAILWWTGSIASIPNTFRLCDGTQFTPDLRDLFIVGSGDTYSVDETGGQLLHGHDFTSDNHTHLLGAGATIQAGVNFTPTVSAEPAVGTSDNFSSLPTFYTLVPVMYDGRPI